MICSARSSRPLLLMMSAAPHSPVIDPGGISVRACPDAEYGCRYDWSASLVPRMLSTRVTPWPSRLEMTLTRPWPWTVARTVPGAAGELSGAADMVGDGAADGGLLTPAAGLSATCGGLPLLPQAAISTTAPTTPNKAAPRADLVMVTCVSSSSGRIRARASSTPWWQFRPSENHSAPIPRRHRRQAQLAHVDG